MTSPAFGATQARLLRRAVDFVFDNSLLLIVGAAVALVWANLDRHGYASLVHAKVLANSYLGRMEDGHRIIDLHYLVNDILMALFFALAGREVWDALLPGGPLHNPRQAALPLVCAVGGMAGPAIIYAAGVWAIGQADTLGRGWAIPCATDIAFSYLVARLVFGRGHPAIPFLLMLAIADDAIGMLVLAVLYPQEPVRAAWLLLVVGAVVLALGMRRMRLHGFWWYLLIPGAASWLGFAFAGLHPALALLPVVPLIPHEHTVRPHVGWDTLTLREMWARFERVLRRPVEAILGLFALLNAGVAVTQVQQPMLLVLVGLLVGKPVGIFLSGVLMTRLLHMTGGTRMSLRDLFVVGCTAGIGFTVAIFVATVAFPPGATQDAAKLGALASFGAAIVAWVSGRLLKVKRVMPVARGPGVSARHSGAAES